VVVTCLLLATVAVAWSWNRVRLDANTDSLMGNDRPYVAEYLRFIKEFGDLEHAWVVIDATAPDGTAAAAAAHRTARVAPGVR
jgi:predicted RND superfamily exporter protein